MQFFTLVICSKGNTALMIASLNGHLELVELLVEHGANLFIRSKVSFHEFLFPFDIAIIILSSLIAWKNCPRNGPLFR